MANTKKKTVWSGILDTKNRSSLSPLPTYEQVLCCSGTFERLFIVTYKRERKQVIWELSSQENENLTAVSNHPSNYDIRTHTHALQLTHTREHNRVERCARVCSILTSQQSLPPCHCWSSSLRCLSSWCLFVPLLPLFLNWVLSEHPLPD